jgi:hypothetical protein
MNSLLLALVLSSGVTVEQNPTLFRRGIWGDIDAGIVRTNNIDAGRAHVDRAKIGEVDAGAVYATYVQGDLDAGHARVNLVKAGGVDAGWYAFSDGTVQYTASAGGGGETATFTGNKNLVGDAGVKINLEVVGRVLADGGLLVHRDSDFLGDAGIGKNLKVGGFAEVVGVIYADGGVCFIDGGCQTWAASESLWKLGYEIDFAAQSRQNLMVDGTYTIDGKTWTKANSATATVFALDGGLIITPAASDWFTTRTAANLQIPLSSVLPNSGTQTSTRTPIRVWCYTPHWVYVSGSDAWISGVVNWTGTTPVNLAGVYKQSLMLVASVFNGSSNSFTPGTGMPNTGGHNVTMTEAIWGVAGMTFISYSGTWDTVNNTWPSIHSMTPITYYAYSGASSTWSNSDATLAGWGWFFTVRRPSSTSGPANFQRAKIEYRDIQ